VEEPGEYTSDIGYYRCKKCGAKWKLEQYIRRTYEHVTFEIMCEPMQKHLQESSTGEK
jgi:hypothetical protein